MSDELTKQDLDGFGVRLHCQEILTSKLEVRTDRNEKDIQSVWAMIDSINANISDIKDILGSLAVKIAVTTGTIGLVVLLVMFLMNNFVHKG